VHQVDTNCCQGLVKAFQGATLYHSKLVDTFEEGRGLSPAEMQVRTGFRDRLPEALKEINTHLLEAEFGQFGKEMPTLLYFHHAHASMRPRRNGLGPVRWRSME